MFLLPSLSISIGIIHCQLLLLFTTLFAILPSSHQQQFAGNSRTVPRARGPASVTISVKHGRAALQGQLETNSSPLILWCHAVDAQRFDPSRRGGGGAAEPPVLPAEEIYFTHKGQTHTANLSRDSYNGTLIIEQAQISHAGQWTCHIRTRDHGNVYGEITVYLRPVVLSNSSMRIDDISGEKFRFEASLVSVIRGQDANLECPVYGYPKPEIHWQREHGKKGLQSVVLDDRIRVENGTLSIRNATYDDAGTYVCKAINMFTKRSTSTADNKRLQQSTVSIERQLLVKSELGWILPLCIILLILTLLGLIIGFCEMRKRRKENRQLLTNANGEDE